MTVTSNSMFFTVNAAGPGEQTGWQVRVLDHKDFTTVVAVINNYVELSIGPTISQPGEGSLTLDADDPFWSTTLTNGRPAKTLLDHEHLWQALDDGQVRFEWLGTTVDEHIVEDDGTRQIVVSGSGAAGVLTWGSVLPPYFPPGQTQPAELLEPLYVDKYFWKLPFSWPMMRMWLHLLRVCQSRGTLPWINPQFTEARDSAGQPWEVVPTVTSVAEPANGYRPDNGTNLLDLLDIHTGSQDFTTYGVEWLEWYMWPGFRLDVRRQIGGHKEHTVIFYDAAIEQKERVRVRDQIANYVCTIDVYGSTSLAADPASMGEWNKREALQDKNSNITDPKRRDAIGQVYLRQNKDQRAQWTVRVPYDQPGRRVFVDYNIGDWVGIHTIEADGSSHVDPYRVLAITINIQDSVPAVELTLQTLLESQQRALQKQLTTLINKPANNMPDPNIVPPLEDGAAPPSGPVSWSPENGYYVPQTDTGGTGGSGGYNCRVFIQPDDPGNKAHTGDFWFDTDYTPEVDPWTPPSIDPTDEEPPVDTISPNTVSRIPGTKIWYGLG